MLDINLNTLSESELITLRDAVASKLRSIQRDTLRPGVRVLFEARGERHSGIVVKRNPKSISVLTPGGVTWRVSPGLLRVA